MRRDDKQLQVGNYRRTIQERPITYTCQRCERERTEMRYPGPTPKYCHACRREVQLEQNRARVEKSRAQMRAHVEESRAQMRARVEESRAQMRAHVEEYTNHKE